MKDKMYLISSDMFPHCNQGQKFVTWNGATWVLDEMRWGTYCAEMVNRGVNMMRWLSYNVWFSAEWGNAGTESKNLTPWLRDSNGKYILSSRNNKYWEIVERMVRIMNYPAQKPGIKAPGVICWIDPFYQYANDADDKKNSPFRNNTIGTKSLYDAANWEYAEAHLMEWIKLSKKPGIKMVIGGGNELLEDSIDFDFKVLRVMDRERVFQFSWAICPENPSPNGNDKFKRLSEMVVDAKLFSWYKPIDPIKLDTNIMRPAHKCGGKLKDGTDIFLQNMEYWAGKPIRWVASDDGCMGATGKPNAEQWYRMIETIVTWLGGTQALTKPFHVEKPVIGVEHLPDDEPWDKCRVEQLGVFAAMGKAYNDFMPEPLENFGKWPDAWTEVVIPEPPTPPDPEPDPLPKSPVKPPFNWVGFWNNRVAWVVSHKGLIATGILLSLILFWMVC